MEKSQEEELNELRGTVSDIANELVGTRRAAAATEMLHQQIRLLRMHLRQELACGLYWNEHLKEGTTDFNALPVQERKAYFDRIDKMHEEPDHGGS